MFLSMVIRGPNSSGQNIDVFIRSLIDNLTQLQSSSVLTYDVSKKKTKYSYESSFDMDYNDFPPYRKVFYWSTHGKLVTTISW